MQVVPGVREFPARGFDNYQSPAVIVAMAVGIVVGGVLFVTLPVLQVWRILIASAAFMLPPVLVIPFLKGRKAAVAIDGERLVAKLGNQSWSLPLRTLQFACGSLGNTHLTVLSPGSALYLTSGDTHLAIGIEFLLLRHDYYTVPERPERPHLKMTLRSGRELLTALYNHELPPPTTLHLANLQLNFAGDRVAVHSDGNHVVDARVADVQATLHAHRMANRSASSTGRGRRACVLLLRFSPHHEVAFLGDDKRLHRGLRGASRWIVGRLNLVRADVPQIVEGARRFGVAHELDI